MPRKVRFYVEVWADGDDYEANEPPDQVLTSRAKTLRGAEEAAMRDRSWEVATAYPAEDYEAPPPMVDGGLQDLDQQPEAPMTAQFDELDDPTYASAQEGMAGPGFWGGEG
jgi:hypothetical protein